MSINAQLFNYLETLLIDPGSCRGFEDEALGACVGLVGWGWAGSQNARMAWLKAVYAASYNKSGGLTAGPGNKSFFYTAIQHRQRSAFQPFGFATPDWTKFDAANNPWALPDPLFRKLDAEIIKGQGLAGARAPTWKDATDAMNKYKAALMISTPLGALGKKLFITFLKRYAPELLEGAIAEWGAVVLSTAAFAAITFEEIAVPIHNAQVKRAFEIDRKRRDYDAATGGTPVLG